MRVLTSFGMVWIGMVWIGMVWYATDLEGSFEVSSDFGRVSTAQLGMPS